MTAIEIKDFIPGLEDTLPETFRLFSSSKISVHPSVRMITLHGSRGPAGGFHAGSDIDLCLVTDICCTRPRDEKISGLLEAVLRMSLDTSVCPVELDLAAVFDKKQCGLVCFDVNDYPRLHCLEAETGCIGLYKIQKGFTSFVPPVVNVKNMYPLLAIWERPVVE